MRLALLVINGVDADEARELQLHAAACEGCRGYLEELRAVSRKIAEIEPLTEAPRPRNFHQKLLDRLEAERPWPLSAQISVLFGSFTRSWRAALPLVGASTAGLAVLLILHHQRQPSMPANPGLKAIIAPSSPKPHFAPTLSTYQFLANRSPEKLDEALALEASHNPAPAPLYTAATLSRPELTE
jgi:hypothetical protein